MTKSPGLHRVSEADLLRLFRTIVREQMPLPITRAGLLLTQFAGIEVHLDALLGRTKQNAIAILSAVLRERHERPSIGVGLVWDGPTPTGAGSRRPQDCLSELIATAEQSLLLTGAALERDRALLGSLLGAMRARQLDVRVVLAVDEPVEWQRLSALAHEAFGDGSFCSALYVPVSERVRGPLPFCLLADHRHGLLLAGAPPVLELDDCSVTTGFQIDDAALVAALESQWQTLIHTAALLPLRATAASQQAAR